ncbi:MAG: Flp family type IVb pilin [Actinobacteria bacterium]|jgi:Flp pilus assembly pilin Flp|nr:MAG: Flp family type IVb pilin [Actinomycetota bacterium]
MRAPQTKRFHGDQGATMVEYCLMVSLIAMVCFLAVQFLGGQTNSGYTRVNTSLIAAS